MSNASIDIAPDLQGAKRRMKATTLFGSLLLAVIVVGGLCVHLAATGTFRDEPVVDVQPKGGTNGTLRVVTDKFYWPYSFVDGDGRLSGREIELITQIANELGMTAEVVPLRWEECIDAAVARKVDLVLTCADTSTGRETECLRMSSPIVCDSFSIFGREDVSSIEDLRGRRIGLMKDGNVNTTMYAAGFRECCREYPSYADVFAAIGRGEVDFTVTRYNPGIGWLKEHPVPGVKPRMKLCESYFCIGVDNRRPELLKKINDALAVLRIRGDLPRLNQKWLSTNVEPDSLYDVVMKHQRAFLVFLVIVALLVVALVGVAHTREKLARRLERTTALVNGLSREYHTVWIIDGETHALSLYRSTGVTTAPGTVEYGTEKPNYDAGVAWYVENFVDEIDQERVAKAVSWEEVVKNTTDIGVYSVTYMRHPAPGKTDYHQMCFAKAVGASGKTDYVFAYRDVDAIVRDQMEEQKKRVLQEAEAHRLKMRETELMHAEFRASALAYVAEHEGDVRSFLEFFAGRLRELIRCDQVIYRGGNGTVVVSDSPALGKDFRLDRELCARCPRFSMTSPIYRDGVVEISDMESCAEDEKAPAGCPVKSSLVRIVSLEGKATGFLTIHYILERHEFTGSERRTLEEFANLLSLSLARIAVKEKNAELQRELQLRQRIAEQQAQLEEALSMAQAANRAKTNFLFNMSHDIRTPMNAIRGFTEIAKKKLTALAGDGAPGASALPAGRARVPDAPELAEIGDCLNKIDSSGELLLSLINGVLDMSRVEAGKAKLEEETGDVLMSFSDVETTLQELAKAHDVALTFAFGEIPDRYVYVDREKADRIFVNLISNAIKYSRPNGWVKVSCEQDGALGNRPLPRPEGSDTRADRVATYRYTFEDNGIGMSEDFQKHLFEQFARERNSTTSGIQGTGLGLALCKSFVELMGGTISCRSKLGEGTVFVVELPLRVREQIAGNGEQVDGGARVDDAAAAGSCAPYDRGGNDDGGTGGSGHAGRVTLPSLKGRRILLVEDNALNREVAEFMLKERGFEVETAEDGSVAVRRVRENGLGHYGCILMDIQMPVMNGYDATRRIREWEMGEVERLRGGEVERCGSGTTPPSRIPIIALSANAFAEDRAASLAAGMDDHIAKPIKVKTLMDCLARFAGSSR